MGTAQVQGPLWGVRARDWAEVQEGMFAPLFEAVLRRTAVGEGTSVLDIGCGSGGFCAMAAKLGARLSGLDAAEALLAIARERVPKGDFRVGEMEELPYSNQTFDLVAGFNSFQFAAHPVRAVQEAGRVSRTAAPVIIAVFGKREDTEAAPYFAALGSLLPPPPPGALSPFAFSHDGGLESLVTQAGLIPETVEEVDCLWEYPDEKTLLRGLLSSSPAIRAIQHAGEAAVTVTLLKNLVPFKTASGGYAFRNKARYIIAKACCSSSGGL